MKAFRRLCLTLLLIAPTAASAGMPSDYQPLSLDEAMARSGKDGKPVMIYFTSDN